MALVVFLRGVNVGGHRTFRPTKLAAQLEHLDIVIDVNANVASHMESPNSLSWRATISAQPRLAAGLAGLGWSICLTSIFVC